MNSEKKKISPNPHHVCPVWVGYLLASPIRALFQNPRKILAPYVKSGMQILDIGSAMGFFSLELARQASPEGRVVCIDIQQKMLDGLIRRANRAGLDPLIEARLCGPDSLGVSDLSGRIDFVLAFAVVHEMPDRNRFFSEIAGVLKPGATLLIAEPKGRVADSEFLHTVSIAEACNLPRIDAPKIFRSHTAVLRKSALPPRS